MRARLETLRSSATSFGDGRLLAIDLIEQAYTHNGFQRLWDEPRDVEELITQIAQSVDEGLDPQDYLYDRLRNRLVTDTGSTIDEINREILLSEAFFRLTYHYHYGKTSPRKLYHSWNFGNRGQQSNPVSLLLDATAAHGVTATLQQQLPALADYASLRSSLRKYRRIHDNGGWVAIPTGQTLKPGISNARVSWLRSRLHASGDLPATTNTPELFDMELAEAVKRFQERHGLATDGMVGPATLAALNVSVAQRIAQIRANLERLRWVSQQLPDDYLLVDIAGFRVKLYRDGHEAWTTRAVVGKPYRQTPVFRASLSYLVLNPSWTVPPTILKEDFLPQLRRDPGFLEEKQLTVVDHAGHGVDPAMIDWQATSAKRFPYLLRQPPGPANALGRIKFMFPNPYSVYLHDTPSKSLFDRPVRAYSSGCIRIDKPLELANLLLAQNTGWDSARLAREINSGKTSTVRLEQPTPVLLMYFTAEASATEGVTFRDDLYQRDRKIIEALEQPLPTQPAEAFPAWLS